MEAGAVVQVNASYQVLEIKKNVLVPIPGAGDQHLKWIEAHQIETINGPHLVKEHYRRGDLFGSHFVTRRFFVGPNLVGRTIVASVKIIEKTDHQKNGEKSLILEIYLAIGAPTSRLKIGSPDGDFPIPGVKGKYIAFKKM